MKEESNQNERGDGAVSPSSVRKDDEEQYPPKKAVLPAMAAIYLSVFLIALDRTIIGTAIPSISREFHSFDDIAWYEAGFLLPLCMLQLTFGRIYRYYSVKWVLIALVAIFELGSIVCAAAPNSNALIIGRVVAGIGGCGVTSGSFILITLLVPLQKRPKYTGGLGAVFGLASILGPLLGGYLTAVTWRWCFWINVPIGVAALVILVWLAPASPPILQPAAKWTGRITQLDPLGFLAIAPATVCLLFATQWGGSKYAWSDGRIIALLVVFSVFTIAFIAVQIWRKEEATIPPRIFLQRSMFASTFASLAIGSVMVIFSFYLPIWFQAIQGKSPQASGLSLIAQLLPAVICVIGSGILTSAFGYYTPFLIAGSVLMTVGAALISTWPVTASAGQWIGFQVVLGAGIGFTLQQPQLAAQTVLSRADGTIGLSLLTFVQFLGGSVFVTVAQTLLATKLEQGLEGKIPGLNPAILGTQGATSIRQLVPAEFLPLALGVYNEAMRSIWYLGVGLGALVFLSSLGLEWKNVKESKNAIAEPADEVQPPAHNDDKV